MTIRLHLKRIRVTRVIEDEIYRLVVEVAHTRKVDRCPACGVGSSKVHGTSRVKVQDTSIMGRPVALVWLQRRFECENRGHRHTEEHPEFEGKVTGRFVLGMIRDGRLLTIRELSRRHGVSWH
jgi:transposase